MTSQDALQKAATLVYNYAKDHGYPAGGSISPFPQSITTKTIWVEVEDPTVPKALGVLVLAMNAPRNTELYTAMFASAVNFFADPPDLVLKYEPPVIDKSANVDAFIRDALRAQRNGDWTGFTTAIMKAQTEAVLNGVDFAKAYRRVVAESGGK